MAPRFVTLMYQVYATGDNGADALVCFPFTQSAPIFPFRDELTEILLKNGNIQVHREQGYPLPPDSIFRFYAEKHSGAMEKILHTKRPGFFSWIINAANWISFQEDERLVSEIIDVEIETSHDFPCVIVHSRIHSEESMSKLIQEVAKNLNLNVPRNAQLGPIQEIVTSNESFDF